MMKSRYSTSTTLLLLVVVISSCVSSIQSFSTSTTTTRPLFLQTTAAPPRQASSTTTTALSSLAFSDNNSGSSSSTRKKQTELSAVAVGDLEQENEYFAQVWKTMIQPVASAALLITGNTIGASTLVLPDVAAQPGMGVATLVFGGMYLLNLISGLLIAQVAIHQYENSSNQANSSSSSSSFKEFAQANLDSDWAAHGIASISIFINACVLAFNLVRMGQVGAAAVPEELGSLLPAPAVTIGFAAVLFAMTSTLETKALSQVASVAVAGLFWTLGGLLLPGLATMSDPLGTLLAPGLLDHDDSLWSAAMQAAPIVLTSLVYQNIVPSVTKLLNYDRTQTTAAIALGSFLPMAIMWAWCFCSLGGGIATTGTSSSLLVLLFSAFTVIGSSIACVMSVSEEIESYMETSSSQQEQQVFSLPSVGLSVGVPLVAALVLGGDNFTNALRLAGSYGSPLLYGAIPVAMAWTQRSSSSNNKNKNLVPKGSLALLGTASAAFVLEEFTHDVGSMLM